jgi:hypothetical protein
VQRGGLPREANRKAGWASAWRPGPAAERPAGSRRCARIERVVTALSPRMGRRGGALTDGPVVASWRQGVAGELVGTTGRASSNESGGEAHRGRQSTVRRGGGPMRRRMVGSLLEGGSAVTLTSSWSCGGG